MRTTKTLSPIVLSLLLVRCVSADDAGYALHVDLVDGSRIVGTPENTSLTIDIGFDELQIPIDRIRRAAKTAKPGEMRLELTNRDTLTGTVVPAPLKLTTIFGNVVLEMKHVTAVEVVPTDKIGWLPTHRGLVVYYALDDGTTATNRAADRHHGTVTGVKWLEKGRRGGAFEFDGNARLTIAHGEELCPQEFTIAAWIHPYGETANYQVVLAKTTPGSWTGGYGLVRKSGDADHLHFFVNSYSGSSVQARIPADEWSHVAGVFDGRKLVFYLNGEPVDSKAISPAGGPNGPAITHTTTPLTFGGETSGYPWPGKMDEIVLYDRPLDAAEIRRLYEIGDPTS